MKRICFLFFILMLFVMSANAESVPYVVFNKRTGTLTFKYGEKPTFDFFDDEKAYDIKTSTSNHPWYVESEYIRKVYFDSSFVSFQPTDCSCWFNDCQNLTDIVGLQYLNTSNVTNMSNMFHRCFSLTSLDLSSFDTKNVEDMSTMFYECKSLESLNLTSFNTEKVKNMRHMFGKCYSIINLDLSNFDTSNVTSMAGMFRECTCAKLDLSNFDTSNVKDMSCMFKECNCTKLDLSNFDTSNVKDMSGMFWGSDIDSNYDLCSSFDTRNVTDMSYMFSECRHMQFLDLSNFNTSNVTNMGSMFELCDNVKFLDLSSFDTRNVTDMHKMFDECSELQLLDLRNFDLQKAQTVYDMFKVCRRLTTIFCNNTWNAIYDSSGMFYGCYKLKGAIEYDYNKTKAQYANPETGYFTYTSAAETYDIKVADQPVTQLNFIQLSKVDGVTGTVIYDHTDKTLYMKDASILSTKFSGFGIRSDLDTLTINVIGNCTIESKQWTAIEAGSIVFTGTGTLTIKGTRGVSLHSTPVENCMNVNGSVSINIDASKYGIDGAIYRYNISGETLEYYITTLDMASSEAVLRVKGTEGDVHNLYKMTFSGEGQHIALPLGAYFSNHTVVLGANDLKDTWMEISTKKYVNRIDIKGYTWPRDFEAADYEVSTTTPCSKVTNVRYEMFRKILDLSNPSDVHARDNLGIVITVKLDDGYVFDSKPVAYIDSCGFFVANEFRMAGTSDSETDFVWIYRVPTPEGGEYVRSVSEKITAPVAGALPQWTSENSAAAGAKAVGGLEVDAKDQSVRATHTVQNIEWEEITPFGIRQMQQGETFQEGGHYAVWFTVVPLEGWQFCERTEYSVTTSKTEKPAEIEDKGYAQTGAVIVKQGSQQVLLGYVFSVPPLITGDVNDDGLVTMADANLVVNYFLATDKSTIPIAANAANVNGDEDITMADANQIVNMFLNGDDGIHKYVDLGLSVKWAMCNVGASRPEEYGDYFAWGETAPKDKYDWTTYKFTTDGGNSFTKYTGSDNAVLDAEDDAAVANWGGVWRMPTLDEVKELLDNCTWEWQEAGNTAFNGVVGYKATSKKAGYTDKYIFLPAAGYMEGSSLSDKGSFSFYWTTSLSSSNTRLASSLYRKTWINKSRYIGFTVRPVRP